VNPRVEGGLEAAKNTGSDRTSALGRVYCLWRERMYRAGGEARTRHLAKFQGRIDTRMEGWAPGGKDEGPAGSLPTKIMTQSDTFNFSHARRYYRGADIIGFRQLPIETEHVWAVYN
jgi:hypothetical protein